MLHMNDIKLRVEGFSVFLLTFDLLCFLLFLLKSHANASITSVAVIIKKITSQLKVFICPENNNTPMIPYKKK